MDGFNSMSNSMIDDLNSMSNSMKDGFIQMLTMMVKKSPIT